MQAQNKAMQSSLFIGKQSERQRRRALDRLAGALQAVRLAEIIRGPLHNRFFPPDAENSSGRCGRGARHGGGLGGQAECSGAVQRAPSQRQTVGRRRHCESVTTARVALSPGHADSSASAPQPRDFPAGSGAGALPACRRPKPDARAAIATLVLTSLAARHTVGWNTECASHQG